MIRDIEVGLRINKPCQILANAENNFLFQIKQTYEGVCFHGCYIKKVLEIKKRSEITIISCGGQNEYGCNIVFSAETVEYFPGDLIFVKIIARNDKIFAIIGEAEHASVHIVTKDSSLDSITKDQIIPCKILMVKNGINNANISLIASIFKPENINSSVAFFPSKNELSESECAILMAQLEEISELEKSIEEIKNEERFKQLEDIVSAVNDNYAQSTHKISDIVKRAADVKSVEMVYYSRPANLSMLDNGVIMSDAPGEFIKLDESFTGYAILVMICKHYIMRLNTLKMFYTVYNKDKLFGAHKNLWMIINSFKK